MAKKETTKKNTTTKKVTKKATAKKTEKEEVLEVPTVQIVNGDPAVLEPVGKSEYISTESPVVEEVKPAVKKREEDNPHEVTSLVAEEIINESQPEEYDSAKPAKKKIENNQKPSKIRKILGYFWNGQEFDY